MIWSHQRNGRKVSNGPYTTPLEKKRLGRIGGLGMRRPVLVCFFVSLAMCTAVWNGCSTTKVKPYNLIFSTDGADANGSMLNPLWGEQFNGLHGNTPGPGPKPEGSPNEP